LGGHVGAFMPLAKRLDTKRAVYGLQAQGLEPNQHCHDRIEDMAKFYLEEIRAVQRQGPYLLAGWSMGGLIAMEAARQLTAAGEKVAPVVMLDSHLPSAVTDQAGSGDQPVVRWISQELDISLDVLNRLPADLQWKLIAERAKSSQSLSAAEIQRLAQVCQAHVAAFRRYAPQPYHADVLLLVAGKLERGGYARWKSVCPRIRVANVPGDHYSILREPDVELLAQHLDRLI
jgi:thioesterase domain-containing protein